MKYVGKTIEGLEDAAIKETSGKLLAPARVIFERKFQENNVKEEKFLTLELIYQFIEEQKFTSLENLISRIEKTKVLETTMKKTAGKKEAGITFSCLCIRKGNHNFNSIIVEQEIGKMLQKKGLKYSPKKPTSTIFIDIFQNTCIIGILQEKELSKRRYRLNLHKQTTPPLLASCLIKVLSIKKQESLLILESKDGIIPIEASLQNLNSITAQDSKSNNIRNANINAKIVKANINFVHSSIKELPENLKQQNTKTNYDHTITQQIFSLKNKRPPQNLSILLSSANTLTKKTLTIITNHPETIKSLTPKAIKLNKEQKIVVGKSTLYILFYQK
tara:strand:+ start:629 stop:1624 length:996 start_codon:yes stop_codon:yes gene_type:complete